jgi:hypothetical protein
LKAKTHKPITGKEEKIMPMFILEDVSKFVLIIIFCLIIFLIGVQVGKRTATRPDDKFHLASGKDHENTPVIQITLKICPESKPEINL